MRRMKIVNAQRERLLKTVSYTSVYGMKVTIYGSGNSLYGDLNVKLCMQNNRSFFHFNVRSSKLKTFFDSQIDITTGDTLKS